VNGNNTKQPHPWPVFVIGAAAATAIWSGWVELGRMTGFGIVQPLPGIWDELRINSAITLPIGMEAYAAYALSVWLSAPDKVSDRARRFARLSAFSALALGAAGQITYHLLDAAGRDSAPWPPSSPASRSPSPPSPRPCTICAETSRTGRPSRWPTQSSPPSRRFPSPTIPPFRHSSPPVPPRNPPWPR